MNSNVIKMRSALKDLLNRENDDAFVIFSDKQTKRFVQFAGSRSENLLLDLPVQEFSKQELKQARRIRNKYFNIGKVFDSRFSLAVDFDKNYDSGADIALDIMCQIFELSADFELEIEEN